MTMTSYCRAAMATPMTDAVACAGFDGYMVPAIMPKGRKLDLAAAASLVRPRDSPLCGFVAGQPVGFLEALGARSDLEDIVLYTGLLQRPYALVQNPGVRVVSGFFGPVERMARAAGARVSYLPADFEGLERLGLRLKPRVALAVTSAPDRDGWLSF